MWIRLSLWVVFCFKKFWKKFRHFYWRKHLLCGFVTEIAFFFFSPYWPILKKVQDRCVSSFLQRRDFFSEKEAYQFRTWSQICQSDFFSPLNTHFCLCPWNHLTWFIFVTQLFVCTVKPFLIELFKGLPCSRLKSKSGRLNSKFRVATVLFITKGKYYLNQTKS